MRAWRQRPRQTASLIRSAAPEFEVPALPEGFALALADASDTAGAVAPRSSRRVRLVLGVGVAALVILGLALTLRPEDASAELRRASSALLSAKWIHEVARQYDRDTEGRWAHTDTMEIWQYEQRQWQIVRRPLGAPISYRYYGGPGKSVRVYSVRSGKLQEWPKAMPLWNFWDWGQLENGRPRWLGGDGQVRVERLRDQRWKGKPVKVLRLSTSSKQSDEVSVFYVDLATGLPVRREATAEMREPERESLRFVEEWDYAPFDPAKLFDPAEMAKGAHGGSGKAAGRSR